MAGKFIWNPVMDVVTLGLLIVGLALLTVGADFLVKGAARLASASGLSSLVIGLTIVAFGTSAPEMAVSTTTAWRGQADIAIGNIVGSNTFNVLFILGASALITPLAVQQQLLRLDVPIMIAASVLLLWMSLDHTLSHLDGLILFTSIVLYTIFLIRHSRNESITSASECASDVKTGEETGHSHWAENIGYVLLGLGMLVTGSTWLVDGAVMFARELGVSELVIGLTVVAAGTSLPEVATSITAALRGEHDIAIGNVIGSNTFNILGVLGLSSMVAPDGIRVADTAIRFDIPVMTAIAAACLPMFFSGRIISRSNGALFLGYYIAYTMYLVFAAQHSPALQMLNQVMLWFVIPLTVITLTIGVFREFHKKTGSA